MMVQQSENRTLLLALSALGATALAASAYFTYKYAQRRNRFRAVLKAYEDVMLLTKDQMIELKDDFRRQIVAGLEGKESSLVMLPSMVDVLPAGNETGEFFALDLGGTNFRTLYIQLTDDHGGVGDVELENFAIPEPLFKAPIEDLFDLLGETLVKFVQRMKGDDYKEDVHVGFCFSFPVEQTAIDEGKILYMTKKFANKGANGADPVGLLEKACSKHGGSVRIRALLNDTVGTLASGRYNDPDVLVGIILGTGTNGAYVEATKNITKLKPEQRENDNMVINTEWGGFMSPLLPMTADDYATDESAPNPGVCFFEKLISGLYMGEAVRRIVLNLAENADLFGGLVPAKLREDWYLTTPDIAQMDEDESLSLSKIGEIMEKKFGLTSTQCNFVARRQIQHACNLVAQRSARLLAVAVTAILEQTERATPVKSTTCSVDGGVFEHYLKYRKYLSSALGWMVGDANVDLIQFNQFRESSSRGAAYLAAAVHHHGQAHIG